MHFLMCLFCFSSIYSTNGNSCNVRTGRAGIEDNNNAANDRFHTMQREYEINNNMIYDVLEMTCKQFIKLVRRRQNSCGNTYFKILHGELLGRLRERCTEKVLRRIIELKYSAKKLKDSVKKMKNTISRNKVSLYRDEIDKMAHNMIEVAKGFSLLRAPYANSLDLSGKTAYVDVYYDEFEKMHERLAGALSRFSAKSIMVPYFKTRNKYTFKWLCETCEFAKMSEALFSKAEEMLRSARNFLIEKYRQTGNEKWLETQHPAVCTPARDSQLYNTEKNKGDRFLLSDQISEKSDDLEEWNSSDLSGSNKYETINDLSESQRTAFNMLHPSCAPPCSSGYISGSAPPVNHPVLPSENLSRTVGRCSPPPRPPPPYLKPSRSSSRPQPPPQHLKPSRSSSQPPPHQESSSNAHSKPCNPLSQPFHPVQTSNQSPPLLSSSNSPNHQHFRNYYDLPSMFNPTLV